MPAELSAYLAVVEECARERDRVIYVVDDGTGQYWSTIHPSMVNRQVKHYSVMPSGNVIVHHPGR